MAGENGGMTSRRHRPLTAVEGAQPALALGDVAARHARLTVDGVVRHVGESAVAEVPWSDVIALEAVLTTTRWPHPAIPDVAIPVLIGLLGDGGSASEAAPLRLELATAAGGESWTLESHYVSGYRRADARATTRLLEHLVAVPESRVLLARPGDLLDRISSLLRPRRPI